MSKTGVFVVNKRNDVLSVKKEFENVDLDDALDLVGVLMDGTLYWAPHVAEVSRKMFAAAGSLKRHGRYNYLLLFASCITHLAAVMDMLGFSIILPVAKCDLQLNLQQVGMLASVPFAGFIFAIPWGYYADTRGRRRAVLLAVSSGFIFSVLSSFSSSFVMMLVLKFIACSFSTAAITLTMTYLGECTRIANRNKYLIIMSCFSMAADFVCLALAYAFLYLEFKLPLPWLISYRPWRLYSLVMSVFLGIGALMMFFLQESPKFLANEGKTEEALDVLRRTYVINGGRKENFPIRSVKGRMTDYIASTSFWDSVVKQTVPIFKPPMLWRTMQLFYLLAVCCSTNIVFFVWFPTMVNSFLNSLSDIHYSNRTFCENINENITASTIVDNGSCDDSISTSTIYFGLVFSIIISLTNLALSLLASYRKIVMIAIYLISGISGFLLEVIRNPIVDMMLYMFVLMIGTSVGHAGSYFVDIYPTSHRGLGTILGMSVTRITCLGGVNLVAATVAEHCALTFFGWSIFIMSGVVVALFLPADKRLGS